MQKEEETDKTRKIVKTESSHEHRKIFTIFLVLQFSREKNFELQSLAKCSQQEKLAMQLVKWTFNVQTYSFEFVYNFTQSGFSLVLKVTPEQNNSRKSVHDLSNSIPAVKMQTL